MPTLATIRRADAALTRRFRDRLVVNPDLDRTLVSFQANKGQPGYRWFKYKEGFAAPLVHYVLRALGIASGRLLDPFAGAGTALFAGSQLGLDAVGIELLPVGCAIIEARRLALGPDAARLRGVLQAWQDDRPWKAAHANGTPFPHLPITRGAFPPATETQLRAYLACCDGERDSPARTLLRFAALCVLEEVSYTRKDGQYLRWDHRAGRRQGVKRFDKGSLPAFEDAIAGKLREIADDLSALSPAGQVELLPGSCLDLLPTLPPGSFDCVVTSPPYCNRYDYTRTYALELALLGITGDELKRLRQAMLACTVEHRAKAGLEARFGPEALTAAEGVFATRPLLQHILRYLEARRAAGLLNNVGIPRMVRHYFWEMTLVLGACARLLKPGAPLVMVNDNVRYAGAPIPVDLILSDIAEALGFTAERIWILPVGKGNSSQQMGKHGRDELRKCVYIWRAPPTL